MSTERDVELDSEPKLILVLAETDFIAGLISKELGVELFDLKYTSFEKINTIDLDRKEETLWVADCTSNDEKLIMKYGQLALKIGVRMLALVDLHQAQTLQKFYAVGFFGVIPTWYSKNARSLIMQLAFEGNSIVPLGASEEILGNTLQNAQVVARALSDRELCVLSLVARGNTNGQISQELSIAVPTVKMHVASLNKKLNAQNRTHLVYTAFRTGLISLEAIAGSA